MVNEELAKKLGLAPQELLGKQLGMNGKSYRATVVGVIANFHNQSFHGDISPVFIGHDPDMYSEMAVKLGTQDLKQTLAFLEEEWSILFPDHLFDYTFLDERLEAYYEKERQFLTLTQVFSILAIFIGCLGIYGLIAFFTVQRTKEIGLRKVLGGSMRHILLLLTSDFIKLLLVAAAVALPLAWYLAHRWLESFSYRIPIPWWAFVAALVGMAAITLITLGYQTLKAARTNPVKSLRTD